jgi:hypothetical protein
MIDSKPHTTIRTTIGEYLSKPIDVVSAIYVIACYPTLGCLYVGKTHMGVCYRLRQHLNSDDLIGNFMRNVMADACGFRLDILILPSDIDGNGEQWLTKYENKLISYFRPMFNTVGMGENKAAEEPNGVLI